MKGTEFRDLRHRILKSQGIANEYYSLKVDTINFKKKIAEGSNLNKIANIVESNRGKEVLMIAGTGTGKTYTVNQYMDELYKRDSERIELICVPSTAQARQLEKEGFLVLVENNSIVERDFLWNRYKRNKATGYSSMKIAFVYDKAETVRKFLNKHIKYKVDLFVDEAHKLYTAYNYRKEAVDIVEKLMEEVKEREGTVVLMTATPRSLAFRQSIDHIIFCKGEEKVAKYGEIEVLYKKEQSQSFQDVVYSKILQEHKAGNKCFIRYNSFDDTGDITSKLRALNHLDVKVVSSKNKDFDVEVDTEGHRCNVYKNDIFNCFVNKSSLPDGDCWFTTSMLDEGGSITKIEGKGQPDNLVAVFVVKDKRFMQIDDAMQFSARIRFPYKKFIFIVNSTMGEEGSGSDPAESEPALVTKKVSKMENLTWGILEEVNLTKKIVESYAELMKKQGVSGSQAKEELEKFTQLENLIGFKNNMGCITIDSDCNVGIDEKKVSLLIYNTYNNQYMSNPDEFVKLLKQESDCKAIATTEAEVIEADFDAKDYLDTALGNPDMLLQIYKNQLAEDELKAIEFTKDYKKVQKLIEMEDVVFGEKIKREAKARTAVRAVCEEKVSEQKKLLVGELIGKLDDTELVRMYQEKNYDGNFQKERALLEEENALKLLGELHTILGDLEESVQKLRKERADLSNLEKFIKKNLDGYLNELYLESREKLWGMDKLGRERTIILDNVYELNESGNMKKKTLNEKLLKKVAEALNEEFGEDKYTELKVRNRIKKMFKLQDEGTKIYALVKVEH